MYKISHWNGILFSSMVLVLIALFCLPVDSVGSSGNPREAEVNIPSPIIIGTECGITTVNTGVWLTLNEHDTFVDSNYFYSTIPLYVVKTFWTLLGFC